MTLGAMAYEGFTTPISGSAHLNSHPSLLGQESSESQHTVDDPTTTHTLSTSRRRSSLKMPGLLKRAVSSPNVRSLASADAMSISSEKKRNKLGYHRTAVACGHCRRRKIRCIPAYEDTTTGRCQNCIRLKKDCHFFPVDQQGLPTGRRTRSGSKAEAVNEPDTSVSSSSPGILGSSSLEQIKNVNGQIHTPPLSQQSSFQSFQRPGGVEQSDFPVRPGIDYQQPFDRSRHVGYPQTSPRGPGGDRFDAHHGQYFTGHEQQILPSSYNNSSYGSTPLSGSMTTSPQSSAFHFPQPSPGSDHFPWAPHPPSRSMSIADTEDLHNAYAAYHRSNTYPSIARRMTATQDPLHSQQTGQMMHTDVQHPAVTTAYHDAHAYQNPGQHGIGWPSSMPPPAMRQSIAVSEAYGQQWYSQPHLGLSNVEEEDHPHLYQPQPLNHQAFQPKPG